MKKILRVLIPLIAILMISCSDDDSEYIFKATTKFSEKIDNENIQWYAFSEDGFNKVEGPNYASVMTKLPWTESIRISSANNASYKNTKQSFAILNRIGIISFEGSKISLSKDLTLFPSRTADNLVFVDGVPVFSVYKSAFFNNSINNSQYAQTNTEHLFLLQYDKRANVNYPVLNCNNLTEDSGIEVVDYNWDGQVWNCCLKNQEGGKYLYQYLEVRPTASFLSITPATASKKIVTTKIDAQKFRQTEEIQDLKKAPVQIQRLLGGMSEKNSITVEIKNAGGASPIVYSNNLNQNKVELKGKGIISQGWSAVLFRDGTLYVEGAIDGKNILNDGNCVALRLPKLPSGYFYSDFVYTDSILYAAWEECNFYETTRSGFVAINLDETLYSIE